MVRVTRVQKGGWADVEERGNKRVDCRGITQHTVVPCAAISVMSYPTKTDSSGAHVWGTEQKKTAECYSGAPVFRMTIEGGTVCPKKRCAT